MEWIRMANMVNDDDLFSRWIDGPAFLLPGKTKSVDEYALDLAFKGPKKNSKTLKNKIRSYHNITLYTIPKGKTLYHASSKKITKFDRMAFFSPHEKVSEMILSFEAKGWFKYDHDNHKVNFLSDPYMYVFRTKRDIHLIYNENMGIRGEFWPFDKSEKLNTFCENFKADGMFDVRDAAPVFPVFRTSLSDDKKTLEDNINRFIEGGIDNFVRDYLLLGSNVRDDPVYSMEFILCNPSQVLELVETKQILGKEVMNRWWETSIEWLLSIDPAEYAPVRKFLATKQRYDYLIGNIVYSPTWRLYHRGFVKLDDKLFTNTLPSEFPTNNPLFLEIAFPRPLPSEDILTLTAFTALWQNFWSKSQKDTKTRQFLNNRVIPYQKKHWKKSPDIVFN